MSKSKEKLAAEVLRWTVAAMAPYDTGNLSAHGVRLSLVEGNWTVLVGGEAAPYAVYTNEEWIHERWHGAVNPNQGWLDKAIRAALPVMKRVLSGAMTEEERQAFIREQKGVLAATRRRRAAEERQRRSRL